MTSTPLVEQQLQPSVSTQGRKRAAPREEAILEPQLQLAVEVLTSKSCSEEGLEDATNLLLQLAKANCATRRAVVQLLLHGARQLGLTVGAHIRRLIDEARALQAAAAADDVKDDEKDEERNVKKGLLKDRSVSSETSKTVCS